MSDCPLAALGIFVNNIPEINIQYNYQPAVPHNIFCHHNGNTFIPSTQSLENIRLKKLPFYEVLSDVIKPTILVGQEQCSLPDNKKIGVREANFQFYMPYEQVNHISVNRDITQTEPYPEFQLQIRICVLEPSSTEITDFLPLDLHIRMNKKNCPLPPKLPNAQPEISFRRIAMPIHCSHFLKLNPIVSNTITVNWIPDGKTYVMAVYVVKKLNSSTLLQKLINNGAKSSEETKDEIIKYFADDFDPDFITTSNWFSLVCPLGKMRMQIPAKSINCNHLQCFDASTFIQMNEKKSTWLCPTCKESCLFENLQIQSYFLEVVSSSNLPDSCTEIELLADGSWKINEEHKKDSVTLADGDDERSIDGNKETKNLKTDYVDLTLSDEEKQPKDKDNQTN